MWHFHISFRVPFDITSHNVKWKHQSRYYRWKSPFTRSDWKSNRRMNVKNSVRFFPLQFVERREKKNLFSSTHSEPQTEYVRFCLCVFVMQNTLFQLIYVLSTVHINPVLFFLLSFGLPSFSHVSIRICKRSNWIKLCITKTKLSIPLRRRWRRQRWQCYRCVATKRAALPFLLLLLISSSSFCEHT